MFARCWLLVEGETEIWLASELAQICGYSLRAEGCGSSSSPSAAGPLIKVARTLA